MAREREPVAVGVKRSAAVAEQAGDAFEVVQQRQLAGCVVPFARVVAVDPCGERSERLDLELVFPPPGS
jgi:hypothetical protein